MTLAYSSAFCSLDLTEPTFLPIFTPLSMARVLPHPCKNKQITPPPRTHQQNPRKHKLLLAEYCRRNAGNLSQNVKDQCSAIKKELKEVILFPKEARGKTNQQKQG